jgi:hypothetical protein
LWLAQDGDFDGLFSFALAAVLGDAFVASAARLPKDRDTIAREMHWVANWVNEPSVSAHFWGAINAHPLFSPESGTQLAHTQSETTRFHAGLRA